MPAVMLPHWSLPPICSSQLCSRHSTIKIKRLQQHVAELGVADAGLAVFHARADAFLGDHLVDGKMFADVAQKIEERNILPSKLALSTSRAGFCFVSKSSSFASCTFTLAMLWSRISFVSNCRSCGLAAGIANASRSRRRRRQSDDGRAIETAAAPAAAPDCRRAGCPPSGQSRSKA